MPTPKKLTIHKSMVDEARPVAENLLDTLIERKIIPRNFSGLLTPRFGKHIMIWQFGHNKLIGAVAVHINNIPQVTKKLTVAPTSVDWMTIGEMKESDVELSSTPDLQANKETDIDLSDGAGESGSV